MGQLKLYEIANEIRIIGDNLIESGGELTPENEKLLIAWSGALDFKASNAGLLIQELQRSADVAEEEAERIHNLATIRRNAAERLKGYILQAMETAGIKKIETDTLRLTVCQNSQPKVEPLYDATEMNFKFPEYAESKMVYSVNKKKILDEWKDGKLPEGVASVEQGFHLRIK